MGVLIDEEALPSLTCWDDGTRVPGSNGRGLDSPQKRRVQEMHAECRTMSISQLARKASLEFGKKVPWTTAYDATTGVHKFLKRVRAQYISALVSIASGSPWAPQGRVHYNGARVYA